VLADAVVFPNQLVITATPGADQKAWKPDSKGPRTNCAIPLHGSAFSRYLLDCYSPFGWLLRMSLRSANFRFSTCSNAGFSGSPNGCPRSSPHGRPDPVHRPGSINDLPIKESERNYHWLGRRPDEHPGVTDLGLCNPQCALLAYALCLRAQGPPGWHWLASVAIGLFQALAQAEQKELFMSNPAFYRMIRTENRTLEIGFLDRGMQAFSLTFG
jgi:hypothetical protein